jgi:hypothetical protein
LTIAEKMLFSYWNWSATFHLSPSFLLSSSSLSPLAPITDYSASDQLWQKALEKRDRFLNMKKTLCHGFAPRLPAQSVYRVFSRSSELGPQCVPIPWGPSGSETHSLVGKGVGEPIQTKGQILWYSVF